MSLILKEVFNELTEYNLYLAMKLSKHFHSNQIDKIGENYYTGHISRVVSKLEGNLLKTIAYLHDIVEDGHLNFVYINYIFAQSVSNAILAITRQKGEKYFDYIHRVKQNELATKVKLADLEDNLDETRLSKLDKKKADSLKKRYQKAKQILLKE